MPLLEITNLNKHGNLRSRIIYNKSTSIGFNPDKLGPVHVSLFKYNYIGLLPPSLFTTSKGEKYIVPTWQKVHPNTELSDINWKKPKLKDKPKENKTWEFKSSSSDSKYFVRDKAGKLSCSCPGSWRAHDRRCKHIKEVEKLLNK